MKRKCPESVRNPAVLLILTNRWKDRWKDRWKYRLVSCVWEAVDCERQTYSKDFQQ